MSYTFTIGGVAMPLPDADTPPEMEYFASNAVMRRMWNGNARTQIRANRWRAPVKFVKLTSAEYTTVWTAYTSLLAAAGSVVFADGKTKTMLAVPGSWKETHFYHETRTATYYDVTFTLEEV